jgi:tetratricopeptide (TPR) repeat protein
MNQWIKLSALLFALAVAGCQTATGRHEGTWPPQQTPQQPVTKPGYGTVTPPVGEPTPVTPTTPTTPGTESGIPPMPLPDKVLPSFPKSADAISGSAVLSLLRSAQSSRAAGQYAQAAGSLERALRIEPRNYFVWSTLADTYLRQKNFDQAISVAQKSNSLGRGNVYVEQENWRVIRDARTAGGNVAGAAEAQARMDAIQQLLQPTVMPQ